MPDNTIIHPSCSDRAHLVDLFVFQGAPINNNQEHEIQILVNNGYVIGYSPTRLQPIWSAYRVAGSDRDVDFDRPHLYYEDKRLKLDDRLGPETFGKLDNIPYHVGHMVPNEVINRQFGRLAQMETFFMSNMSPQRGSLNTGVWLDLEKKIRNIEDKPGKDHIWIISGPIFDDNPETLSRPDGKNVPIPKSYYSIVADPFRYPWNKKSNVDLACFIIPQDAESRSPLDMFLVRVEDIEIETKLDFFPDWRKPLSGLVGATADVGFGSSETRHRLLNQLY